MVKPISKKFKCKNSFQEEATITSQQFANLITIKLNNEVDILFMDFEYVYLNVRSFLCYKFLNVNQSIICNLKTMHYCDLHIISYFYLKPRYLVAIYDV